MPLKVIDDHIKRKIFLEIQNNGFDPAAEFLPGESTEENGRERFVLTYIGTEIRFMFQVESGEPEVFIGVFTPYSAGEWKMNDRTDWQSIDSLLYEFGKWLSKVVKRYVESRGGDPWANFKTTFKNVDTKEDNIPLSTEEGNAVKVKLDELPNLLAKAMNIPENKLVEFKKSVINDIVEPAKSKVEKKEPRGLIRKFIIGALVEKAIEWSVEKSIGYVLPRFIELIQSFLNLPMPPGL